MKVEVLDGCPNYQPTVERVKEVLRVEGLEAEVFEIKVSDQAAQAVGFQTSPTMRVDGFDVEGPARFSQRFRMACRTYLEGSQIPESSRSATRSPVLHTWLLSPTHRASSRIRPRWRSHPK